MDKEKEALKEIYESMQGLFETYAERGMIPGVNESEAAMLVRGETMSFILYISGSDGVLSASEAQAFEDITGLSASTDDMVGLIDNYDLKAEGYGAKIPYLLELIAEAENHFKHDKKILQAVVDYFKFLGAYFARVDGNFTAAESSNLNQFLARMQAYVDGY